MNRGKDAHTARSAVSCSGAIRRGHGRHGVHRLGLDSGETCRGGVRGVGGFGAGGAVAGEEGGDEGPDPRGEGGNDGDVEAALAEQEELDVDDEDRSEYGDVREERLEGTSSWSFRACCMSSFSYLCVCVHVCSCLCVRL